MFLFLKKKNPEDEKEAEATPLWDYLPYHGHYDRDTVITKNGELLQIIKVDTNNQGLRYESGDATHNTVRDVVRKAIGECVGSDRLALWVHTLRKRSGVTHGDAPGQPFAAYLHEHWQDKHAWKYQYHNEIYISVLYDGQQAEMFDKKTLRHVLLPKPNRHYRNAYLERAHGELEQTTTALLDKIRRHYRAERLSVVERAPKPGAGTSQPVFYSQPMEFLGSMLNLHESEFAVSGCDMSQALCTHALTFGFNAVEARAEDGQRRFGALLSLKQYREMPPETVDRVLQSSTELIVSESFSFIPSSQALRPYRAQKYFFDVSGDKYSIKASGLHEMLQSDKNRAVDFGQHQTTIMVLSDEYRQLDAEVYKTQDAFADLGLIATREDIRLEEGFWAQFPGNFEFIRRKDIISTGRVAGFCRLNRFPGGTDVGNHWGEAVTVIPTMVNSPYFFNFHAQDNGHTALFDFNSFGDRMGAVLTNFLLTLSLKYQGRIFLFDRHRSGRLFMNKLDAPYHGFPALAGEKKEQRLRLNPFSLEGDARNQSFLLAWCMELVKPSFTPSEAHKEALRAAIAQLYAGPAQNRHLEGLIAGLDAQDAALAQAIRNFAVKSRLAEALQTGDDNFDPARPLQGFDMDAAVQAPGAAVPIFSYLLHRIITSLDGKPAVIVLHEACDLLENDFFAPRLESLMEMLKQSNALLLCTTQNPRGDMGTQTFATLMKGCATRIYLPDDINAGYEEEGVGLSAHDSRLMQKMERQRGDFMLQQGGESMALRVNLDDMDDVKAIFCNDIKNLIAAGGPFASLPQDD